MMMMIIITINSNKRFFSLLGWYAASVVTVYRCFETACRSHLKGETVLKESRQLDPR